MYTVSAYDHQAKRLHLTHVESYAEAKKLAYRATHAIKRVGYNRQVVKPLPYREVRIAETESGRRVIWYLGNHMVTESTAKAVRDEVLASLEG